MLRPTRVSRVSILILVWIGACLHLGMGNIQALQEIANDSSARIELTVPGVVLQGVPFKVKAELKDNKGDPLRADAALTVSGSDGESRFELVGGTAEFEAMTASNGTRSLHASVTIEGREASGETSLRAIPAILSILPPFIAIVLALVFRQVLVSLFAGIWLGAFFYL